MVVAEDGEPSGPPQKGRGVHGQYVRWITMPYPKEATVAKRGLKTPARMKSREPSLTWRGSSAARVVPDVFLFEFGAQVADVVPGPPV